MIDSRPPGDRGRSSRQPEQRGTLVLSDETAYVGDAIRLEGRNLPPETEIHVVWHSWEGQWGVLKGNEVAGPQYGSRTETIGTVSTDEEGRLSHDWTIPQDYGGEHTLELQGNGGETLAEAEVTITPWFELDRTKAELGEAFTVIGYGIGPENVRNNYQITWDGTATGFVTGVQNRGTATARIRGAGPPGEHVVQVYRNALGVPFLQNNTQSAFGEVAGGRQSVWQVEVTEPETEPPTMWMDDLIQEEPLPVHYPDLDEDADAELEITPTSGQAGDEAVIEGQDFPPSTEVNLVWYTQEGIPYTGVEVTPARRDSYLPRVTTDTDGTFEVGVTIPTDIGSTKPIVAEVDGRSVAVTGFMMQQKIETFEPTSGHVGTEIEIELSGVGWPKYECTPYFVYDNRPLGYICSNIGTGTDVQEVVKATFRAYGEPGLHFIDVYPSLFDMRDDEPDFVLKPHLSYLDNHPVRPLPAMHFTFEVTE
ncbi:MAG: hypothetical protein V5A46_06245 [Haloferacaceae archaeon]